MSDTPKQPDALPDLWPLILAYAGCRIDCDRSKGEVTKAYLALAESDLRAALAAQAEKHAAQVADLQKIGGDWWAAAEAAQEERDALRAQVDALRADAERYRWLRSNCECLGWGNRSDAAIDADSKGQTP